MFLLYINDIADDIKHSSKRLFADDCLLYRVVDTKEDKCKLQRDLFELELWSNKWQLDFNIKKCYQLCVRKKGHEITSQYTLKGKTLKLVEHRPYLGVEWQSNMKWDQHIHQITAKANRSLGFLRRNLSKCPEIVKEQAYQALVHPHIKYASAVWDPYLIKDVKKVESVLPCAAQFVKNNYVKEKGTVTNLLKELGWPSLEHRRKYHHFDLFYKTKSGKTALQIPDQLNRPMSRPMRTMDSTCLIRPITKGDNYAQSYFPQTIRDWNNLTRHIRHYTTESTFKSALFKHFFE